MSETEQVDSNPSALTQGVDHTVTLAALRQQGRDKMDTVRFHFIETLARRAQPQSGPLRRVLDDRLAKALAEYNAGCDQAQTDARDTVTRMADRSPDSGDMLWALFSTGDFRDLRQQVAKLERNPHAGPLADLVSHIMRQTSADPDGHLAKRSGDGKHDDLKSVSHFRGTWLKLQVEQTVKQALATGPSNAGPLNAHSLILQSLKLMSNASPGYLNQFMAYADAMLWLDRANMRVTPTTRKADKKLGRGGSRKKKTSVRSKL